MNNDLCRMLGCDFPVLAFSHCRDVVAAVSRAGGFGVLGAVSFTPEQLELELKWIDEHVDGKPYGIDVLLPEHVGADPSGMSPEQYAAQVPAAHRQFARDIMAKHGVEMSDDEVIQAHDNLLVNICITAEALMDVAFAHPIKLIANALGVAPRTMIERARRHGVPVAALVGAKEHAVRQVQAGVDIIVAQGTEAAGHCGEVTTLVLVPEVIRAVQAHAGGRTVPVLAAGGIITGRQVAAAMALGAQGAWTGTVWLATTEAETSEALREKMVQATSRDTLRSRYRSGKPLRQLNSTWFSAWEGPDSPGPLPFPMMGLLSQACLERAEKAVAGGNEQARALISYPIGQGVGLIEGVRSTATIMADMRQEFADALGDLMNAVE